MPMLSFILFPFPLIKEKKGEGTVQKVSVYDDKYLVSILNMLLFTMSDREGFKVSLVTKIYDSCRSNNLKNND